MNFPSKQSACPCGSGNTFSACCEPLISKQAKATTPEALMRSRYTAYAVKQYDYILETYVASTRPSISPEELGADNTNTLWLTLEITDSELSPEYGYVSFRAFYKDKAHAYCLAEKSRFVKQDEEWFYVDGDILPASGKVKIGRNDPCLCGSQQKSKRCCFK
ncbi:YchJ family protein [Alteromonas facilis]|uniref:YchJ family protein n=1 Tax=Alteromonas facilis TaxID=2048004 RepID=UPI000C28302E|nr:YchJ family protein [Alteromonas facilis]